MRKKFSVAIVIEIEDDGYNWTPRMAESYLRDVLKENLEDDDKVLDIEVEDWDAKSNK